MEKITMLSEVREEKNLQNAKDDYKSGRMVKRNREFIDFQNNQIVKAKISAIQAIEQGFTDMAKSYISEIEARQEKIQTLIQNI